VNEARGTSGSGVCLEIFNKSMINLSFRAQQKLQKQQQQQQQQTAC